MAGFSYRFSHHGGKPMIKEWLTADTTWVVGDLANNESGEADLAATNDAALIGAVIGVADPTKTITSLTASTDYVLIVSNIDAVYGVADNNARNAGANLDISGASGAQTVAAASNNDLIVHDKKRNAADETLVRIATGESWMD